MSSIKKLTGMGGDIRQIAKLLQAKAPPGHKLAFISEEEAALLKSRGGSGRITPEGIPSYEETIPSITTTDQGFDAFGSSGGGAATAQPQTAAPIPDVTATTPTDNVPSAQGQTPGATAYLNAPVDQSTGIGPSQDIAVNPQTSFRQSEIAAENLAAKSAGTPNVFQGPQDVQAAVNPTPLAEVPQKPGFYDRIMQRLEEPKTLAALGIGGTQALLGANAVRKAQNEAAQAKQQLQAMAAPYQQQGQQLQQLAQQGQLTPANQQTLQAARAQLAQGAEARGGVGSQQAANQIATLTQSLLANQMNMGIQLQGVGDKIAQGAIQTGIQADQYINQLTSNYAQNIARTVAGGFGLPGQTTTITVPSGGQ
jgi:hypothetical protein